MRLEASLQLSEGVNMARRMTVMNIDFDTEDDINLIKDVRDRSNACYKCGEWVIFRETVNMMVINHPTINKNQMEILTPMIL